MKKLFFFLAVTGLLFGGEGELSEQEINFVKSVMPSTPFKKIERDRIDNFYRAYTENGRIFYINPFHKVYFVGELISETGYSFTAHDSQDFLKNTVQKEFYDNLEALKSGDEKSVKLLQDEKHKKIFNKGSKKSFVIIESKTCPNCTALDKYLKELDISTYIYYLPDDEEHEAIKKLRFSEGVPFILVFDENKKLIDYIKGNDINKLRLALDMKELDINKLNSLYKKLYKIEQ